MSNEVLKFNEVKSLKLPQSCGYIYNNLVQYYDSSDDISYYSIINGYEVWIIQHFSPSKVNLNAASKPNTKLHAIEYDKLDSVSAINWCRFNSAICFIMGTENGRIYVYNFDGNKLLSTHKLTDDCIDDTINCLSSNGINTLFIGLSSGKLLSFEIDDTKNEIKLNLKTKKIIFKCDNNESINCLSKPSSIVNMNNKGFKNNNKLYIGCNNGSVIEFDYYSNDINVLINIQNNYNINDNISDKNQTNNINNCGSCICLESCDQYIVAGYSSGHIKIVEKTELSFIIKQISMHRRLISSVAIYPELSLIATVSEDCYFHIISLSDDGYANIVRSGKFENSMLIGVKFNKSSKYLLQSINDNSKRKDAYKDKIILCTAYDKNRLVFV